MSWLAERGKLLFRHFVNDSDSRRGRSRNEAAAGPHGSMGAAAAEPSQQNRFGGAAEMRTDLRGSFSEQGVEDAAVTAAATASPPPHSPDGVPPMYDPNAMYDNGGPPMYDPNAMHDNDDGGGGPQAYDPNLMFGDMDDSDDEGTGDGSGGGGGGPPVYDPVAALGAAAVGDIDFDDADYRPRARGRAFICDAAPWGGSNRSFRVYETMEEFLHSTQLSHLAPAFAAHGVDMYRLTDVADEGFGPCNAFLKGLGVSKLGERHRVIRHMNVHLTGLGRSSHGGGARIDL